MLPLISFPMKFGLIGHPIQHSLSPALFKAGYNGRYPYELIETPNFEEAYQLFLKEYDGINVTAPFKELAYTKADIISEECRLIGATNLMVKSQEGITAYNSDYRGLLHWINSIRVTHNRLTETTKVLIVGLGGAGKAAAAAAWNAGTEIILMNRDISKAHDMSLRLGGKSGGGNIQIRPLDDFCDAFIEADIIIYNLPVHIPALENLRADPDSESSKKHILEANYKNPSFNQSLLNTLKHNGLDIEYHNGLTWLLLQAMTGYELFTGEKPDLSKMAEQI